jgi:hypothetical protein
MEGVRMSEGTNNVESLAVESTPEVKQPVEGSEAPVELSFEDKMDAELKKSPRVLKINGKEKKISSWAEWERYAAREMSAEDRFQDAQKMKSEAEQIKQLLDKGDILEILRKKGLDQDGIKKVLSDVVQRVVEDEELDPRDRKLKEYEEKERKIKEAAEKEAAENEQKEKLTKVQAQAKKYVEEISESADRLGLVADPMLLSKVAHELKSAYEEGVEISVDDAVRLVRDQFVSEFSDYVRKLPLELKREIFGEESIKELQNAMLAGAKAGKTLNQPEDARKDSSQADETDELTEIRVSGRRGKKTEGVPMGDFFRDLKLGKI